MGGLTYGAIEAGAVGLTGPRVLAAFGVAVAGLAVLWSSRPVALIR
jgi:MFS transporter, DHA2 family, methylenomycin A resistance protein